MKHNTKQKPPPNNCQLSIINYQLKSFLAVLICLLPAISHAQQPILPLIPYPRSVEMQGGSMELPEQVNIYTGKETEQVALTLQTFFQKNCGKDVRINTRSKVKATDNAICLINDPSFSEESYNLQITASSVILQGRPSGIFYALQTLLQLMPTENTQVISLPQLSIRDEPRFAYRGVMIDVGRYFYDTDFLKKFIDCMASYKFNVFHWHLTEYSGWRIEINRYPDLTRIGAFRRTTRQGHEQYTYDRLPNGGYYTQEDINEMVRYAAERHITIIPEIEMPGHSLAMLAAYPELSCTGGPFKVQEDWGIEPDILCAGNEKTFEVLENILDEVIGLFPSKIIHIGGDEAPKIRWKACPKCQQRIREEGLKDENELQSYFIRRIQKYMESKGREILGWDEILEGGIAPGAMVMSWRGEKGGIEAARQHHRVVMAPTNYMYFDYYQGNWRYEPLSIGGYVPLDWVYSYEPYSKELTPEQHQYIYGVQGNLWSEYIHNETHLEYMAFPRVTALSEIAWSPASARDYTGFRQRLSENLLWLEKRNINYRIPDPEGLNDMVSKQNEIVIDLKIPVKGGEIFYTIDGNDPLQYGKKYTGPLKIHLDEKIPLDLKCVVRTPLGRVSRIYSAQYTCRK